MAGFASAFRFNSLISSPASTVPSNQKSISSLDSRLFGLHLRLIDLPSTSLRRALNVSARYGGGGGPRFYGSGSSRRGQRSETDDEEVLDVARIRSSTVRLIDQRQNMVGIVPKSEAIQMAEDAELDLVIVSPEADPPVVRIMDYSKYRYELQKKKKEQQKKSGRMDLKELKMGYNIDQHDYSVRLKAARKFLQDGDKVKVIVNMKGRENDFRNIAIELIKRFQNDVGELAVEESKNFRERNLYIILVPNKALIQKTQEAPKKKNKPAASEVSAGV